MAWDIGLGKTFFLDWCHVEAGQLQFDPDKRVFSPRDIPRGVRITPEKPKPSQTWMKADKVWEELYVGGYVTAIREGDRFRLWYESYDRTANEVRLGDWTGKLCTFRAETK